MDKTSTQATCPRCSCIFNTQDAISSTLICPECMCVFTISTKAEQGDAPHKTSSEMSSHMSAAEIVARNSEAAAKIIESHLSQSPIDSNRVSPEPSLSGSSSSDETVISNHNPSERSVEKTPEGKASKHNSSGETVLNNAKDPASLTAGDMVDNFRVIKVLGKGAMGVVLQVNDELLHRKAALKFMGFALAFHENCRNRFIREGRILASLSPHPNLVPIYSGGQWLNIPYFVMEYVEGMAFNEMLLTKNPIPLTTAVKAAIDTAKALRFVWEEGKLIHRDIKPANLMFDSSREKTVVTDFGLAKPDSDTFDSSLTGDGAILGTPDYISPEQIRCEKNLDWRADLYSLGCTLFHLVTGKPPFSGISVGELIAAHLKEPVPRLSERINGCPDKLDSLVFSMMAKEKDDRPSDYMSVIRTLETIGKGRIDT